MAEGLSFNYAAKQVDDTVLAALAELAEESQLADKFEELYNGAVINTGEKRLVLHHFARRQLGQAVYKRPLLPCLSLVVSALTLPWHYVRQFLA